MILDIINEEYCLTQKQIGDLEKYRCSGMNFHNSAYDAKGLGSVSYTEATMPFGLMKMTSLVVNPFSVDAPLISIDVVEAFGKVKVYAEIYDTTLKTKFNTEKFREVNDNYCEFVDDIAKENWYDSLIIDRIRKVGKKKDSKIYELGIDCLKAYLNALKDCPACDIHEKKMKAKEYSDSLLAHGGPATDPVKKTLGEEKTSELFNRVMFGTAE